MLELGNADRLYQILTAHSSVLSTRLTFAVEFTELAVVPSKRTALSIKPGTPCVTP